jgi:hypothetical protein
VQQQGGQEEVRQKQLQEEVELRQQGGFCHYQGKLCQGVEQQEWGVGLQGAMPLLVVLPVMVMPPDSGLSRELQQLLLGLVGVIRMVVR